MYKVVDYCRVSTEEEKQINALKTQQEENLDYISKQEDWTLVDRYVDEGKSATTTKGRSDFQRLMQDMVSDKFDIILIKVIDRAFRNTGDWKDFEQLLIISKKKLFFKNRNNFYDIYNPSDYILTGIEAQFSEWYSLKQSEKMNNAHKTRMKKGTIVTNGMLWGYDQINAKLVINEKEAEIVRNIFNSYAQGKGFRTIANELKMQGVTNKNGNDFSLTTLKRIIKNEKYKGTLICGKRHKNYWTKQYENNDKSEWIIHENAIPAIVDIDTWQKANDILHDKRRELNMEEKSAIYGYYNGSYPLSSKIKCGKCGKKYYRSGHPLKDGTKKIVWQCKSYREFGLNNENGCDNSKIDDTALNNVIRSIIINLVDNKTEIINLTLEALEKVITEDDSVHKIDKINAEISGVQKRKNKLIELYTDELITKTEFKSRNEEYNEKLIKLDDESKSMKPTMEMFEDKKEKLKLFEEILKTSITDKSDIGDNAIKSVVLEVIVFGNHIVNITLNNGVVYRANLKEEIYTIEDIITM